MSSIQIEPRTPAHAAELFAILSEPSHYDYIDPSHKPASLAALSERLERNMSRKSPDGTQDWLAWIIRDAAGVLVGYVTATIQPDRETDIGYGISSAHWGNGYAMAAIQQILPLLVAKFGVSIFCIIAEQQNTRSVRLAQKLGFVEVDANAAVAQRHALLASEVLLRKIVAA